MPSITPTMVTLSPSVAVMNSGRSAWMISDDVSIRRLTIPSAITVGGTLRRRSVIAHITKSQGRTEGQCALAMPAPPMEVNKPPPQNQKQAKPKRSLR